MALIYSEVMLYYKCTFSYGISMIKYICQVKKIKKLEVRKINVFFVLFWAVKKANTHMPWFYLRDFWHRYYAIGHQFFQKDQLVIISDKIPLSKIDSSITWSALFSSIWSHCVCHIPFILCDVFMETKQYVIILDKDNVKERF